MGNWAQLVSFPMVCALIELRGQWLLAEEEWGGEGRWMRTELPPWLVFHPDRRSIGSTHDTWSKTSPSAAQRNGPRRPRAEPFLTFSPRHSSQPDCQGNQTTPSCPICLLRSSAMFSLGSGWTPLIKVICTLNGPRHYWQRYSLQLSLKPSADMLHKHSTFAL